ncbi:uncharacterized protein LOC121735854 [Aricia agestis]|uniref:uncharacterized protein LOC121735854 n=1 Tax=Aricia agestis TaxID=91739 RepID=UPI001C205CA3|nr:uncharacterized protein LOC121735854 [Aricia agestis]
MPKKLKAVATLHFSHEIRKDIKLTNLKSLKLDDAWPFIREEIEAEIGSSQLICIPHITEADLYKITSIFVQNDVAKDGKMFKPLGVLNKNINRDKTSAEYVKLLEQDSFDDASFKFPHESVKITLQDENLKNKVRVIMLNFSKKCIPSNRDFVNNVYLDLSNHDLKGKKSVYMITKVLMAKTIEFRVSKGDSARIFHLGNLSPLVFGIEEFKIGADGKLIAKEPVTIKSKELQFKKLDPADTLYIPEEKSEMQHGGLSCPAACSLRR